MNNIYLTKRIKQARTLANLSQKDLGKRINVTDKTISAYELGRAIPPLIALEKISKACNLPIEFFFENSNSDKDKVKKIEEKLDIIMKEIKKLSKDKK